MFSFLPGPVRGTVALLLYAANTIVCFIIMLPVMLLKTVIPHEGMRHLLTRGLMNLGTGWITVNSMIMRMTQKITWDVRGIEGFDRKKSYLVISNHRSWADILVLQHLFNYRIPFLKFFLKKELIWVPLLGMAWWALDFPFMKRYSREFVEKHPELKGKDIETTRRYCRKFKKSPISVINFLEGTRFNYEKHARQQSPYQHLLLPRAGGIAIVLSSMGEVLSGIVDVTIVYPENEPPLPFWDFLKGRIPAITVRVRSLPIPQELTRGNYEADSEFRQIFQQWVNRIWEEKDRQIGDILAQHRAQAGRTQERP